MKYSQPKKICFAFLVKVFHPCIQHMVLSQRSDTKNTRLIGRKQKLICLLLICFVFSGHPFELILLTIVFNYDENVANEPVFLFSDTGFRFL
ncbi:unnamed protein product [Trifolium pratense]|uniref:Uncharacterized protein n=1 Tax=Trifolium pratense TaxID=57577 RepID=A0ACB0JSK0_TRIPR|nr:unnamed protein product [Trifolium pratense]